jgi:hypothetical protein
MSTVLKDQAQQIDKPNQPLASHEFSISSFKPDFRDKALSSSRIQEQAEIVKQQSTPSIQGEFKDFDPTDLDRGIVSGMDQNEVRAENQSGWQQLGAAAFQVGNELLLGTAESLALLGDVDMHAKAIAGTEQDFSNSLSDYLRQTKDELNAKYGKVYLSKEDSDFSPLSGSWWASNAGNIATALTLMIPSMGVAKGVEAIAKSSKLLRAWRLGNAGKKVMAGISAAITSRLVENAMESGETVRSLKAELKNEVDPNTGLPKYTEEQINQLAGEAGVSTWRRNAPLVALDFMQYSKAFKGMDYARRTMEDATKKSLATKIGGFIAKDMGGEGLEEGYQYISSQEAQYSVKQKLGVEDSTGFLSRLAKYVTDDEFKTSVLMGAVGGGIFSGVGTINSIREEKRAYENRMRLEELHSKNEAAISKNPERFAQAEDTDLVVSAIQKANDGNLDQLEADLSDLYYTADSDLSDQGLDPKEYREKVERAKNIVTTVAKEYNRVTNEDINPELRSATLYSRVDRKLTELHKAELAKAKEALKNEDLKVFATKEATTAEMMVKLKTLIQNGNTTKADSLAKTILDVSDVYKNIDEIINDLDTPTKPEYDYLTSIESQLNSRIEEAKNFENLLKTKEGQEKLLVDLKAREAKRILEVEKRKKEQEELKLREEATKKAQEEAATRKAEWEKNRTPEQKSYSAEREEKVKEFGEHDPGTPDGKRVFTTSSKEGARTWVAGEQVRDDKGNIYDVIRPGQGNKYAVLKTQDGKFTSSYTIAKEGNKLSHESSKPGRKDWTVNKFVYQDTKKLQAEERAEIAKNNDLADGILKTVNQEFENYVRVGQTPPKGAQKIVEQIYKFEGTPEPVLGEDRFPIDYKEAASVFNTEEPQTLTLTIDDTTGESIILVKKEDRILALITEESVGDKYSLLIDYIAAKGNSIEATLKDKKVTAAGNLGNIIGETQNVRILKDSEFLPDGKIFIGSKKPSDAFIQFTSEDGSSEQAAMRYDRAEGDKTGSGNTYILLKTPNGDLYPVMLKESTLSDVTNSESGLSVAETTYNKLEQVAEQLTTEMNALIEKYSTEGDTSGKVYTLKAAIEKVKKEYGEAREEGSPTEIGKRLAQIVDPIVRRVQESYKKEKDADGVEKIVINKKTGKPVKIVTANYFNTTLIYKEGENNTLGKVQIGVTRSLENPDKGAEAEYIKHQAKTKEEAITMLGSRFMAVSLDIMNSPEGGSYITKMINEGWFTTDLNAERPWVNPRLVLELNDEAKTYMANNIKKRTQKTSPKKKTSEKEVLAKETEVVKNVTDMKPIRSAIMAPGEYTPERVENIVNEFLSDLVTVEEFNNLVEAEATRLKEEKPDMRIIASIKNGMLNVAANLVTNRTVNTIVSTIVEPKTVVESEKKVEKTVEETKPDKEVQKPTTSSKKKGNFGKPKVEKPIVQASEETSVTPTSTEFSDDILGNLFNEISNEVENLGETLSEEAKDKARNLRDSGELDITCK